MADVDTGTENEQGPLSDELEELRRRVDAIPKFDFIGQKIHASSFALRDNNGVDKGYVLIRPIGDDGTVGDPIGRLEIDMQNCRALLKALRDTELMMTSQQGFAIGRQSAEKEKVGTPELTP